MAKITKAEAKAHNEARALVRSGRPLTDDEKCFVLDSYHEGAEHMNSLAGAFFTPEGLARDLVIEVPGRVGGPQGGGRRVRVIDLCAGIGRLAHACASHFAHDPPEIVCVELNPEYVEVGRAVLPEATWVHASVFDVAAYKGLGPFDCAISNPPFGRLPKSRAPAYDGQRYRGPLFEYHVLDIAARLASWSTFLVPQTSAPFHYSGSDRGFQDGVGDVDCHLFRRETGIVMRPGSGVDTAEYLKDWRGVSPLCEIVLVDRDEVDHG